MALAPAATLRTPSAKIAWARMVEVLVPSPTASPVRSAASRSICGAEVLLGVLQLELLGDGHAVVADERLAPLLLDQHALGLRAERHAHGVGQGGGAAEDLLPRRRVEQQLLMSHGDPRFRARGADLGGEDRA